MSTSGPSLTAFVLVGWMIVPVMFPRAIWALIILTLIYLFTKITETIVVEKGSLPSIYHCYFKTINCCKRKHVDADDVIPYISSQCADVVLSTNTMYTLDTLVSSVYATKSTTDATDATDATDTPDITTPSSIISLNNSEFLQLRANKAEAFRLEMEEKRTEHFNNTTAAITASQAINPVVPQNDLVARFIDSFIARRTVPVSDETLDDIARLNNITTTTYKDFSYSLYHIPCFNMDISSLIFTYFPLSIWNSHVDRVDMTILRSINRKIPLYITSRVTNVVRDVDSKNNTSFIEVACINDISARLFDLLDEDQCALQGVNKDNNTTTLIASVTHYYQFDNANASKIVVNAESKKDWQDAVSDIYAKAKEMNNEGGFKSISTNITPDHTSSFANLSGNIHPRYLKSNIAKFFNESGHSIDGLFMSTLTLGAIERLAPTESLLTPFRFMCEFGTGVDKDSENADIEVQAPIYFTTNISDSMDIQPEDKVTNIDYPHILERQLRLERAHMRQKEDSTFIIDPTLTTPSIAEKLLPRDWKKIFSIDIVAKDSEEDKSDGIKYGRGIFMYNCTPIPSLELNPDEIEEVTTEVSQNQDIENNMIGEVTTATEAIEEVVAVDAVDAEESETEPEPEPMTEDVDAEDSLQEIRQRNVE